MNTSMVVVEKGSDDEVVTRGILREVLKNGVEKRMDAMDMRFDSIDKKFDGIENKIDSLTHELRVEYPRYIGALLEDNFHRLVAHFEGYDFKSESFERYMDGNEKDREMSNRRISRLEAEVF